METVFRYIRNKFSFRLSSSESGFSTDEESSISSIPSSASALYGHQYPFVLDPKRVAAGRHNVPPKHLPSPGATVHEVRYFLFHLLTSKQYKCAKTYPEWVLETCMAWDGMGNQIYVWDEERLRNICPSQAAARGILCKRHIAGSPCPPPARIMIGEIVVAFVTLHRNKRHTKVHVEHRWDKELSRTTSSPLLRSETSVMQGTGIYSPPSMQSLVSSDKNVYELPNGSWGGMAQSHFHGKRADIFLSDSISTTPMFPRSPSITSSSLSTISPTDSQSTRTSDSTGQSSPPCSTHEEPYADTVRPSQAARVPPSGQTARTTVFGTIREIDSASLNKPPDPHFLANPRIRECHPSRYRSAGLGQIGHAPRRPSLLRVTATVDRVGIPELEETRPGGSTSPRAWNTHHRTELRDKEGPSMMVPTKLPASLEHDNEEDQPDWYTKPEDLKLSNLDTDFDQGRQRPRIATLTTASSQGHDVSSQFEDQDVAYLQPQGLRSSGLFNGSATAFELSTSSPALPNFVSRGPVTVQDFHKPCLPQHLQGPTEGQSVNAPTTDDRSAGNSIAYYQPEMRKQTSTSSSPGPAPLPRGYPVYGNYSNNWDTGSEIGSVQADRNGRPSNNYKVDEHALSQAERMLARQAQTAVHKAERDILLGGQQGMQIRRARSDIAQWSRSAPAMSRSSTGLNPKYYDPVSKRRRPTLYQMLEEREAWDKKESEYQDRSEEKRGGWYPAA